MTCYHPLPAYQRGPGKPVRLLPPLGTANLQLRCNKCLGCLADRAQEWGERCFHEAQCHRYNVFATFTYAPEHVPAQLEPEHMRGFIKRLRNSKRYPSPLLSSPRVPIRYFLSGEYGALTQRPHYHAILFNADFADKKVAGTDLYISETMNKLWGMGEVKLGEANGRSACYVAGYTAKKLGAEAPHDADGVVLYPPFVRMSRRPGLGTGWLRTYAADLREGFLVQQGGGKMAVPRFYRKKLAGSDLAEELAHGVHTRMQGRPTPRLRAKEMIHRQRVEQQCRGL